MKTAHAANKIIGTVLILIILSGCTAELVATPTGPSVEEKLNSLIEYQLANNTELLSNSSSSNKDKLSNLVNKDLSLEPPKIDPKLVEELKQGKKRRTVLVDYEDEKILQKIKRRGGIVKSNYKIGGVAVVELPTEIIEELSKEDDIKQLAAEREYSVLIQDRIEANGVNKIHSNYTGKNIKIAVLDTGIGPHVNLTIAKQQSFTQEGPEDNNGHGTHVAGIAKTVAPSAQIYNAKVLNSQGSGTTSQIIAGINWALNPDNNPETDDGAHIISISFGGHFTETDGPLASAIKEAIQKGTIIIAAAGNCRQGCGGFYGVTTPGNVKEVITVGAIDDSNDVASFSSGDTFEGYIKPDLTAPGVGITSTWLNNGYNTLSGTSMSTPFISGIVALLLNKNNSLTHEQVKQILTSTASDKGNAGWDTEFGAGVINVNDLFNIEQPLQEEVIPIEIPEANITSEIVLDNFTIVYENETYGEIIYTFPDGIQQILTYSIIQNSTNGTFSSQMSLPYTINPSSSGTAIFEFQTTTVTASQNPRYVKFRVRSYPSGSYDNTVYYSVSSSFINNLIAGNYITTQHTFTSPPSQGQYRATAEIVNNNRQSLNPAVFDLDGPTGFIFTVQQQSGPITCYTNSNCPPDAWANNPYCQGGNVYDTWKDYSCFNPGTPQSFCAFTTSQLLRQTCTSGCSGGQCVGAPQACTLTSVYWQPSGTVQNQTQVQLVAEGQGGCQGKRGWLQIWEEDGAVDDYITGWPNISFGSNNKMSMPWTATWIPDPPTYGNPTFYIEAGIHSTSTQPYQQGFSNLLTVTPSLTCADNDGDGWGNPSTPICIHHPEVDCDDNNVAVHPRAPEICDNIDNNCNSQIDEGNVCCGNSLCDTSKGENPTTCGQDCYATLLVDSINSPISANQQQQVQVTVNVKNTGTYEGSANVEVGIIPDYWLSTSTSVRNCAANPFFAIKTTGAIQPSQTSQIQAVLTAPGIASQDACQSNPLMKSAWDSSHEVVAGLYTNSGPYTNRGNRNIQIADKPCSQQSHCNIPVEKCVILSGQSSGTCQLNNCVNTCSNGQYGCSGATIRHCVDTNNDGCYEWKDLIVCTAGTCLPGLSTCQQSTINTDVTIEEAVSGLVWKQINDTVTLNLKYNGQEQLTLNYDLNQFESLNCAQTFTITQDKSCKFKIKTSIQGAELGISKQGTTKRAGAKVATTANHNGIILTNKKKLYERFPSQTEVKQLLEETYSFANKNNNKLIVYDVVDYVSTAHPWSVFSSYSETPASPFMVDNSLSIEIGEFIRSKCDPRTCRSTLILGDDYVVPHYRRYVQFLNSYLFFSNPQTNSVYSELPYIERAQKEFSQLDEILTDNGFGKSIVIIKADQPTTAMQNSINKLKSVLQSNYNATITEKTSSQIYCDDTSLFNSMNDKTVIIIGTEQANRAFNCMPFVAGLENRDTAFLEVNPWDGNEYSIIINTENANVVSAFSDAVRTKAYKKMVGRVWYYIEVGVNVLSFASLACDPFLIPCDIIIDATDSAIQCGVKQDAILCGTSVAMLFVPYVPSGPVKIAIRSFVNYVGPAGGKFLTKYGASGAEFLAKHLDEIGTFQTYLKKAADYFGSDWDNAIKQFKFPYDEFLISKGARIIESKGLTLADVAPKLFSPSVKAKFFRDLGKISEIQSDNYAKKFLDLHDIQGIENLAKNVVTDQDGYKFEVDVAIGLKNELQEVSKQLKPVIGIDGEIDGVLKSGDVYDAKYDWGLLKHTDNKWDKKIDDYAGQISRAKQFLAATGNPNKQVIFIFNTDLSKDMDDFLKLHGVQVRKLENGKLVNPQVIP